MDEHVISLFVCLGFGGGLAIAYLSGLWLSLCRLARTRRSGVRFLAGVAIRTMGTAALLVLVTRELPGGIVASLLGFIAARTSLVCAVAGRRSGWI